MKFPNWWICFMGLVAVALLTAPRAESQSPKSEPPALSEKAQRGYEIFEDRCMVCHDQINKRVKLIGPLLNGLFKRKTLVTGKPVNEANVTEVIKMGPTPKMPAFRYTLSDQEIGDVVEFLQTK